MVFKFKQRCFAVIVGILPLAQSLSIAAIAQQQQQQSNPAPELEGLNLIYDPLPPEETPSLNDLPGATAPGNISGPEGELTYNGSRAWPTGATPDQIFKIGDLKQNPQLAGFTKLRLKDFSQNIGTDIEGVPLKDIEVVNGVNLKQLKKLYDMDNVKVKDALPAVQVFLAFAFDPNAGLQQVKQNALSTGSKVLINKLRKNPALKDVPFERVLAGDWRGTIQESEKILLKEAGDKIPEHLRRLPIGSLTVDLIEGDFDSIRKTAQGYAINEIQDLTIDEVTKRFPEIEKVPISVVSSIANQPLSQSLPKLADYTIEELEVEDKLLSSIPGLSDTPLGSVVGDVLFKFLAGDVFARFDIAYSGQDGAEYHNGRPLSGGTKDQKFKPEPGIRSGTSKTKNPQKGMPRIEMKPAEGSSNLLGSEPILGKEWMTREQEVPGCKGFLCILGKYEPAGIKPVRDSMTKFSLGELAEYEDEAFTARVYVDFQLCVTILFTQHCTAHIFGLPTPFKVTRNSLFPVLSKRRVQDLFPGINEQGRSVDFCQAPDFLGGNTAAGNSPPSGNNTLYGHHAYDETTEQLRNVSSVDGIQEALTEDTAQAFEQMVADAGAEGLDIKAVSGFRDTQRQQRLFEKKVRKTGSPEEAAKTSAPAGHSEHHTGYAVDVATNAYPFLETRFAETPEYAWMQANAGKYGFELSFPDGNNQGVSFEPWHWRYVGSEQARQIFAKASGQDHGTAPSADGGLQPIDGASGAPRLDGIPGQPGSVSSPGQTDGDQNQGSVSTSSWGSSTDVHNLILTSALESTGLQNQVDVAVSIMNRVTSPKHPDTITDVVYAAGQYEPNFGYAPVNSKEEAISRIASKSGSVEAAIAEYEAIEAALNNPQAIAASQAFLGGATDFRGQSLLHNRTDRDPYRGGDGANYFFAESQDPAVAAATLGGLGVESAAVDPNSISASSVGRAANCDPTLLASNGSPGASLGPFQQGDGITTGQFGLPTEHPISSPYGPRSLGFHSGIDYRTPMGSEIRASDGGVVIDVEENCPQQGHLGSECGGKYGNLVFIEHSSGYITVYGHLSATNVKIGDPVKKGQVIALSGNSGRTTGPHLHFEIRDPSNQRLNPANFLK